ncbi:patatin-like phospholipase family protein [Sabulicella glaciei]|uniref:Patatin-like phospholipase family protein n=1 Tax=Sabulicella glaciei TaxID=2984948 RepID=A0ABT3P3W4_9PROT|nr:patatin-like phospholipase family protein [Roseococcus sp. MDT2-1-1]MCW8088464.1 patatin-like phospholipase family protein [Roseococcus sp. MDT2-1-1]
MDRGYRPEALRRPPGANPSLPGAYMVLAFSGGGTRATALAQGVLRELDTVPAPGARRGLRLARADATSRRPTLLEAVDMISSASGGSVAAANFALLGPERYREIEGPDGFLRHRGLRELVVGVLNPANAAYYSLTPASRIELLSAMFQRKLFGQATYRDLEALGPRRPFLVLNAADMASGERFPLTQQQLDRLCLDIRDLRLADAVAASAAFPVLLTPLPLPNHSPCTAQREIVAATDPAQPLRDDRERVLEAIVNEADLGTLDEPESDCGVPARTLRTGEDLQVRRGLRQFPLLNLEPCTLRPLRPDDPRRVRMVHLLDGGTADNLGLSGPLETLTTDGDDRRVFQAIRASRVDHVVVVAVNARSQSAERVGADGSTPGVFSMLFGTINTAIDGRTGGLLAQLPVLKELLDARAREMGRTIRVTTIPVDFEMIRDPACRAAFQAIDTTWTLSDREVDAVMEMGGAMLRASPGLSSLAALPQGEAETGQARAAAACRSLQGLPPPTARVTSR